MSDDREDDNVRMLGVKKKDRVLELADALCKVLRDTTSVNNPEEHLAALYLAEGAVQHIVATKYGPSGLGEVLRRANEIRRSYDFKLRVERTIYDEDEQPPAAPVIPLKPKDG